MSEPDLFSEVAVRILRDLATRSTDPSGGQKLPQRLTFRSRLSLWCANRLRAWLAKRSLVVVRAGTLRLVEDGLQSWAGLAGGLNQTYSLLADAPSRRTMVEVLTYRLLGPEHVKLSMNDERYLEALATIGSQLQIERTDVYLTGFEDYLRRYNLRSIGFPITLESLPLGIHTIYLIEQYGYSVGGAVVAAEAGDVVIDGGGCWGDTALYFAHRVGAGGKVTVFEFEPQNLEVFRKNLSLNPDLGSRIALKEVALWHEPGQTLGVASRGPGTRVTAASTTDFTVPTTTIDEMFGGSDARRVDFIKLDIEGAELSALRGAEATLRRDRPKLAVAVYHDLEDFVTIPAYLHSLNLGYRFYLRHCTIDRYETILYARTGS